MMPHACHFPLGKTQVTKASSWTTELIKPINEMVKYLNVDKDLKNGYKLGDILTKTCFVEGDTTIYQQFLKDVRKCLTLNADNVKSNVKQQLDEDLENFDLQENLSDFLFKKSINIKHLIYRSITVFLAALGSLQNLDKNSGFEIIEEFQRRNIFNNDTSADLSLALAVACHIRLFHYFSVKKQDDIIRKETETVKGEEKLSDFARIVGIFALCRCLVVSFILQEWFRNDQQVLTHFDYTLRVQNLPQTMKIWNMLGLYKKVIDMGEQILLINSQFDGRKVQVLSQLGIAYEAVGAFQKYLAIYKTYVPQDKLQLEKDSSHVSIKFHEQSCLLALGKVDRVIIETNAILKLKLKDSETIQDILQLNGESKFYMKKYHEALGAMRDLFRLNKADNKSWDKKIEDSGSMEFVSLSLIGLGRIEQGLHWAWEGLNYLEKIGAAKEFDQKFYDIIRMYDQANPTSHELRFFKKFAEIFPVGFRPAGMLDDIILFQRRVGR